MSLKRAPAYGAALAITTLLAAGHASALTFASFGVTGGTRFALTSDSFSAMETGNFSIATAVPLTAGVPTTFTSVMTLTGTLAPGTGGEVTFPGGASSSITQNLASLSFTIQGTSGAYAGVNLLSGVLITPTGNNLSASVNNITQSSTASIGAGGTDANIGYTSALLAFLPGSRDLSFTLNNISPSVLSVNGTTTMAGGFTLTTGDIENFLADASANFSATPSPNGIGTVPEPGTVAMLFGMGVSGMAFGLRARRRK